MSGASHLIERHREVLSRSQFHWDSPEARLRIDIETGEAIESWLAAVEDGKLALRRVEDGGDGACDHGFPP